MPPPAFPEGLFFFQWTNPTGVTLLTPEDFTCRQEVVPESISPGFPAGSPPVSCTAGSFHANGLSNGANGGSIPIQLIPFSDTNNPGGEYKVWLTPQADYNSGGGTPSPANNFGFSSSRTKTDTFKVKVNAATVKVCKFNDLNGDSVQGAGEPFIPHWPITANGVDGDTCNGVTAQTDDNGCISFTFSKFTQTVTTETVTLTEGALPGWQQIAPLDCGTLPNCTVTGGGVITVILSPGNNVQAPNFGNICVSELCGGTGLVVTKDDEPTFTRTFTWQIQKNVDKTEIDTSGGATFNYTVTVTHDSGVDSGWQVTGNIKVSNPTPVDIGNVNVTDAIDDGGTSSVTGGTGSSVPSGSQVDLPYICTYSGAPTITLGTNTATAVWDDGGTATGTAGVDFSTPTTVVDGSVTVTDSLGGSLGTVSSGDASPKTFTYPLTFTDPAGTCTTHNNTATLKSTTRDTTRSAGKSVKVCVGADLAVGETAVTAYNSNITKSVDKTLVEQAGGSITFNYTVNVATSGWTVSGNITVTNPNDWEAITANVSDVLSDPGGSSIVTRGNHPLTLTPQ